MKRKMIMTGLMVALGIGQISAQVTSPSPAKPAKAKSKTPEFFYDIQYDAHDLKDPVTIVHGTRSVKSDGTLEYSIQYDRLNNKPASPASQNTTTLTTIANCNVTGDTSFWQSIVPNLPPIGTEITPLCPPFCIDQCGTWSVNVRTVFTNVPCPINSHNFPLVFKYYMLPCSGNFTQVGQWNVTGRQIVGNCLVGYVANQTLPLVDPDCVVPCPSPTPTPSPTPSPTPTPTPTPTPMVLIDQDLNFSSAAPEDCQAMVYNTWTFGPYQSAVSVHVSGNVDDDVRIDGITLDSTCCPFNSGRNLPCDGLVNGQHSFDTTFTQPSGSAITIDVVNNFASQCSLTGHITISN